MIYQNVINRPLLTDCYCVQLHTGKGPMYMKTGSNCRNCYGLGITPVPYWEMIFRMHALEKDKNVRQLLIDIVNKEVAEGFDRAKSRAEFADSMEDLRKQSAQQK